MSFPTALGRVSVAGTVLERYFHACAFFDSRETEYAVLGSYYEDGLVAGEKGLHIVQPDLREDHRERLRKLGIDVDGHELRGALEVVTSSDTYLAGGTFDPDKMLGVVESAIAAGKEKGFTRTRIMGNMGWAFEGESGSECLLEYEVRVNDVLSRNRHPAICVYDTSKLSGTMMLDILRSHPLTIINGGVHENHFFTPPDVFLAELALRKKSVQ